MLLESSPLETDRYPYLGPNVGWSYSTSTVLFPVILADTTRGSCSSYTGALVRFRSWPSDAVPVMLSTPVAVFSTPLPDSRIVCLSVPLPSTNAIVTSAKVPLSPKEGSVAFDPASL